MADDDLDLRASVQDRSWSRHQRAGWWVKYAAVVGPTVALLTLLSTCGGLRVLGVQTTRDADTQHKELESRMVDRLDKSMGRIEQAMGRMETRLDAAIQRQGRDRGSRGRDP